MQITTTCKNCNNQFDGKFCNHCGQAADTHRLNMHHIWHDLQHGLFHFDNGIFYTVKQLLKRPGHTIREFINGKRVGHFKPLSFVVILATVYGLLYHYFIGNIFNVKPTQTGDGLLSAYEKVIHWTTNHFAYATLLLTITTTIASYLVFWRQGYHFAEHFVLNAYYRGLVLVIVLLFLPVFYLLYKEGKEWLTIYAAILQIIDFVLMYWCYTQFFNKLTWFQSFVLTLLAYSFTLMINLFIAFASGLIANAVS
ncbi:MAG TPA: DUF3667 domain-containing protein [Puia sp.]|nr:DUF3667 domain-containing protein [Puia sp.]